MFRNIYIGKLNPNIGRYIDIDFCTNIFYVWNWSFHAFKKYIAFYLIVRA